MTRNDDHRMPLHFAVLKNKPEMVALLIELGADPLALDGSGQPAAMYATSPHVDRAVMEKIRDMFASEVISATRGDRPARAGALDVIALLALADYDAAEHLLRENPNLVNLRGRAARDGEAKRSPGCDLALAARRRSKQSLGALGR